MNEEIKVYLSVLYFSEVRVQIHSYYNTEDIFIHCNKKCPRCVLQSILGYPQEYQ